MGDVFHKVQITDLYRFQDTHFEDGNSSANQCLSAICTRFVKANLNREVLGKKPNNPSYQQSFEYPAKNESRMYKSEK